MRGLSGKRATTAKQRWAGFKDGKVMNQIMRKINADEKTKQAINYVVSNPCCICSCESFCGVKYKNTCKIRRKIRLCLWAAKNKAEETL